MLYPLLIIWTKARDYRYNKEEIYMNSNVVTGSEVTEWSLPFLRRNYCNRLCRRDMDRTTPDVLSRACVRDEWSVSRHKKGTHIILK